LPPDVRLDVRAFSVPKQGNQDDENEDAFHFEEGRGVFAMADGATEGVRSGDWARLLVDLFVESPLVAPRSEDPVGWAEQSGLRTWVEAAVGRWNEAARIQPRSEGLPWYVERAAERGSYATLLGFTITEPEPESVPAPQAGTGEPSVGVLRLTAVAVGDSCLFIVRSGKVIRTFPVQSSSELTLGPRLLSTAPDANEAALEVSAFLPHVDLLNGDVVVMTTDAIAAWLLSAMEGECSRDGERVIEILTTEIKTDAHFANLIANERSAGAMRNDDCTVVIVQVSNAEDRPADA
jgi:serine/threonine protein phosphatase PrpC